MSQCPTSWEFFWAILQNAIYEAIRNQSCDWTVTLYLGRESPLYTHRRVHLTLAREVIGGLGGKYSFTLQQNFFKSQPNICKKLFPTKSKKAVFYVMTPTRAFLAYLIYAIFQRSGFLILNCFFAFKINVFINVSTPAWKCLLPDATSRHTGQCVFYFRIFPGQNHLTKDLAGTVPRLPPLKYFFPSTYKVANPIKHIPQCP